MKFVYEAKIEIELSRVEGKFASRDEMHEQLLEAINYALDSADPGSLFGENGGEYVIDDFSFNVEAWSPK